MKKQISTLLVGVVIGFVVASLARTLIYGVLILGLIAAVVWGVLSVRKWRDKIENLWN